MTVDLLDTLCQTEPQGSAWRQRLTTAESLSALVWIGFEIAFWLARGLIEQELERRAQAPTQWPDCPHCGRRLRSKGFRARQVTTWVGTMRWRRRVGRCPGHCAGAQVTPLDEALGVQPYQQFSVEVERLGCLLSLFLPFDLAADLMEQLSDLSVSSSSLWQWVQRWGQQTVQQLESQLNRLAAEETIAPDVLEDTVAQMTLVMAADGVMVPMRPRAGTPPGQDPVAGGESGGTGPVRTTGHPLGTPPQSALPPSLGRRLRVD